MTPRPSGLGYNYSVATTLSIQIDTETEQELAALTAGGRAQDSVIIEAIRQAYRQATYARMRHDADALRNNSEYQAEVRTAREGIGLEDA